MSIRAVLLAAALLVTMGTAGCLEDSTTPNATFEKSQESANPGEEIEFDASASTDPEGEPMSFRWDFGDGNTGDGEVTSHAYEDEGEYVVTLTVTTEDGREATAEDTVEIEETMF